MDVANELLDAIEIIVDKKIRENTAQIYPGICKSVSGNSCVMSINGKDNTIQFYGSIPTVGAIYRVFVPNGNMSMAFAITGNDDRKGLYYSNPNLLDNWYFGNPVNQRGKTEYTSAGYTIDRWELLGAHKMELADNGLKITCNASATVNHCLAQVVEGLRTGLTYTLSALIVENTTANGVNLRVGNDPGPAITGTGLFSWTFVASGATDLLNSPGMQFNSRASDGDNYFVVLAMKLELGSQQTLAHQDADGNWVLNEIPNYGEQLRRCQRYDYIIGRTDDAAPVGLGTAYSDTAVLAVIELPETMRVNPAVSITGWVNLRFSTSKNITVNSVSNYGFSGDKVQLYFSGLSGLTQGQSCDLYTQQGSKLEFNSNL